MKIRSLVAIIAIYIIPNTQILANTHYLPKIVTFSTSASLSNNGKNKTLTLTPGTPGSFNRYHADKDNDLFANYELFLGWKKTINHNLHGQYGVAFATTNSIDLKGDIWQFANPNFNNALYTYKLRHRHIALKGKLLGDFKNIAHLSPLYQPYISGSLGIAFNRAYNYNEKKKINAYVSPPLFNDRNTTDMLYNIGIGLQRKLHNGFDASVGYEFSDLGKHKLKRADGQITNQTPRLNNMYTHSLQFSLNYNL